MSRQITKHKEVTIKEDGNSVTNITQNIKVMPPKEKKSSFLNKISKIANAKMSNRRFIRPSKQVTVDVSQPVYTEDRSRFFKKAWKEDKRQLYFD